MHHNAPYCSMSLHKAPNMSSNIQIPKTCTICGSIFIAKTTVTKNCSDVCRKRAYKLRQRELKIQTALSEQQSTLSVTSKTVVRKPIQHQDLNDKQFMSINEISDLIGISRWSIQRMLKRGEIPFKQFGRKKIINRQELEKLFK